MWSTMLLITFIVAVFNTCSIAVMVDFNLSITNASETPVELNCSTPLNETEWLYERPGSIENVTVNNLIRSSAAVGLYFCLVDGQVMDTFHAFNLSKPTIPHSGQSITFITDNVGKSIDCFSYSYPSSSFRWSRTLENNEVKRITNGSGGYSIVSIDTAHSRLLLPSITHGEEGSYICTVHNLNSSHTQDTKIKIRVHDRLAPLWPFLGIVGEIAVVCFFVYLIRRKAASEEKRLGSPFQESNSLEDVQDPIAAPSVRYRSSVRN